MIFIFLAFIAILILVLIIVMNDNKEDVAFALFVVLVCSAIMFGIYLDIHCSHNWQSANINTEVLVYRQGKWYVVPSSELKDERYYRLPYKLVIDANDEVTADKE